MFTTPNFGQAANAHFDSPWLARLGARSELAADDVRTRALRGDIIRRPPTVKLATGAIISGGKRYPESKIAAMETASIEAATSPAPARLGKNPGQG